MSSEPLPPASPLAPASSFDAQSPTGTEASNAHGLAISQLVAPQSSASEMTKISSPSAPVAPSLPESVTAHEAPDRQVEEPSAPQAEEASTENGQGATKMEVDTPAPTALQSEVPVASESQEQASTSLKRNSPDEVSEHERTVKRVKEEEKVDSMNVDSIPQSAQLAPPASSPLPQQPSPSTSQAPLPSQDAPPSSSQPASNSQPTADFPVSDPALLPPHNLYLPGSYLPPARRPLGSTTPMNPQQFKAINAAVKYLKKQKEAFAFTAPVDPVLMNIPHYSTIITRPMDLSTVEYKLSQSNPAKGKGAVTGAPYRNMADVVDDVRQIWVNTRIFNGPEHMISQHADRLEETFESQIERYKLSENAPSFEQAGPSSYRSQGSVPVEEPSQRARRPSVSQPNIRRNNSDEYGGESNRPKREIHPPTPKDSTWVEPPTPTPRQGKGKSSATPKMKAAYKAITDLMNKVKYKNAAAPFYVPVDPIALGIPAYFDVIKRPMDLSTIANKITHEQYNDVTGVDKDIRLMIKNCFTFNPPGTPVHVCGEELQGIWNGMWKGILAVADFEEDDEDPALNRELEDLERQRTEITARIDEIHRIKADKGRQRAKQSSGPSYSKPGKQSTNGPAGSSSSKPMGKPGRPAKNASAGAANGGSSSNPMKKKQNGAAGRPHHDPYGDSDGEDDVEVTTLAQKQELADKIADADADTLMQALELITKTTSLGNHNDEIELDIDALPPGTIAQLYNLVIRGIQPGQSVPKKKKTGPKPGSGGNGHTGGMNKKPGRKPSGVPAGKTGKGGRDEMERIKALELELKKLHDGGHEDEEGDDYYGYDGAADGDEEDYEGADSEEEG